MSTRQQPDDDFVDDGNAFTEHVEDLDGGTAFGRTS